MKRKQLQLGAGLALVALLGAACGSDDEGTPAVSGDDPTATSAPADTGDDTGDEAPADADAEDISVETGAAELRAGMTHLLQEHVYLAGAAIAQAVADGGDMEAPATVAAVETLDTNSVDLAAAIGSVYGAPAEEQFLAQWRDHIGFFVDYTLAGAGDDMAGQEAARAELDAYGADFGAFIEGATEGEIAADDVAAALDTHVESLIAAIDAVLEGSPEVYPLLQEAAMHMPMTAEALSGAIVAQQGDAIDGAVDTTGAETRAVLTSQLSEHVYLAGLAINQAVADGGDMEAPATKSAVATLDGNTVALSETIESVYGPEAGEQFLTLWRDHIGFFVDYTLAGAGSDTAGQEEARAKLDAYGEDFGAFIENATDGNLPGDAVAAELETHVASLITAIDSVLAGEPAKYPNLREAAGHMPMTAQALAAGILGA